MGQGDVESGLYLLNLQAVKHRGQDEYLYLQSSTIKRRMDNLPLPWDWASLPNI